MSANKWLQKSAIEIGQAIRDKEITCVALLELLFSEIKKNNDTYNCFVELFEDDANAQAKIVQKKIDNGTLSSPLAGVPVAVKALICVEGQKTNCGSKMLENFEPHYSATVVEKLKEAGMIVFGSLNMDEFAMGSTNETSYFGPVSNPWNTQKVSGGSSGGVAAAVALRNAFCALGSDTGGSIRQPSAYCGVTGLKPTYGKVSRYGAVAYASSLDQIGPVARDAVDCATLLNVIAGKDPKDQTSVVSSSLDIEKIEQFNVSGLRVGVPEDFFSEAMSPDVRDRVKEAVEQYKKMGATVEMFSMPIIEYAIPTYMIISCAEASSNLARFDGVKYGFRAENVEDLLDLYYKTRSEGFGMEVKRRIMLGNFVLSSGYYDAYYKKALRAKAVMKKTFEQAFEKYDVLIAPVAPETAPNKGESLSDPLKMYLGDIYTVLINIVGLPAISIPCGFDSDHMPVGLQIIGKHFDEQTILGAAAAFQRDTDYHLQMCPEEN